MTSGPGGALVGRDREIGELDALLASARDGRGGLALLVGEPGIGKTRLADAFATAAAGAGARVAWGRAWEAGGAPAYWPWIEVLREVTSTVDEPGAVAGALAVVAELVPELRARFPSLGAPPRVDPAQARFQLFDAVTTLLRWSARGGPLVVVLDDLHAADAGTLSLLHFAARAVRRAGVLLVGTYRDVEARVSPTAAEELARIAREGRYLPLARLDRDDIASWVRAAGEPDALLADLLFATTEGNPLFVIETFRLVRARRDARAVLASPPDSVRAVIGARLRALGAPARELLAVGAVLGRTIDVGVAAAVLGVTVDAARERLAEAERLEVVAPAGPDAVAFTHILLREALYGELAAAERADLHARVARAMIDIPGAPPAAIVHHLFAAGAAHVDDAIAWARRAAARAARHQALDDAVSFLERALAALPPGRDAERCDLLLELACARIGAGHGARGRDDAHAAATLARRLGDRDRLVRAALAAGELFTVAVVDRSLVMLLEEALAALPPGDSEERARLLARLAAATQPADDPEGPMAIAREAIAMGRRVATPAARVGLLRAATSTLFYFADPAERIELDTEALDLATQVGDRVHALKAQLRLAFDHLERGDVVRSLACVEAHDRLAREIGHPAYLWHAPLMRAMHAMLHGRFAEAEERTLEARSIADRTEDPNREVGFAKQRIGLLRVSARHGALAEHLPSAVGLLDGITDHWYATWLLASTFARLGRIDQARATLAGRPGLAPGRMSLAWLAEAAVALDDAARAAAVHDRLLPLRGRLNDWGLSAFVVEEPIARALGMLAAQLGRWDDAERYFAEALAQADAIDAPPHRARIELDLGVALARRGDRERAARLLDAARATGEQLGQPGLVDAATAQLDALGGARRAAAVPSAPGFALRRDGDVWVVDGGEAPLRLKTSRGIEILARLVEAPDRELHVTDLAAPAGERGLVEDAGEVLDAEAIASYRRRRDELQEELAEAEEWNDAGRAARVREELELLAAELSRAVGLGGRRRRAASTTERARINVQRRLSHAIKQIAEQSPSLGRYLEWTVQTGQFCAYRPAGRSR